MSYLLLIFVMYWGLNASAILVLFFFVHITDSIRLEESSRFNGTRKINAVSWCSSVIPNSTHVWHRNEGLKYYLKGIIKLNQPGVIIPYCYYYNYYAWHWCQPLKEWLMPLDCYQAALYSHQCACHMCNAFKVACKSELKLVAINFNYSDVCSLS